MRALIVCVALCALTSVHQPPPLLDQVLELGELRVVTRNAPTTYYMGADVPTGPEFDLVNGFAEELGVDLVIQPRSAVADLIPAVRSGQAHLAAAGLSITEERLQKVVFSQPYQQVEQHLVYRRGNGKPDTLADIEDAEVVVMAGSSHAETLAALTQDWPTLNWREDADTESAELLEAVASGEIPFTVADSTDFSINRQFHPELRIALDLDVANSIAWAFPTYGGRSLVERADQYLQKIRRNGELTRILDRYYGHNDDFDYVGTRAFIRHYESRLPRYREMFESAADRTSLDWTLLAAIGYQESHWRRSAVSPTGVRGIMMLTRATADYVGIQDREDPAQSIAGGAAFFGRLKERIGETVPEPDRTWMALAAYNVGYFHLKDARKIVEMQQGDPNRWVDVRNALPLLAQRRWYQRVEHGYARGWEPVTYVENIRNYRAILKWLERQDDSPEGPAAPEDEMAPSPEVVARR